MTDESEICGKLVVVEQGELAIYDPVKGLETIAVAEAAEKHWARAKDPSKLYEAIEWTLTEQRKFVRWWDGLGEKRGNPTKRNRSVTFPIAGRDGMPGRMVVERWRKRTADGRFERVLAEAQKKCRIVVFNEEKFRGTQGTGEDEWFTPRKYIALARVVLGAIDLDPATHEAAQQTIQAAHYYTKADDGLVHNWHGHVWLNPPYSRQLIGKFIAKLCNERTAGRVTAAIMLTHNYTDTEWFHQAVGAADAICFTRGRVKFFEPDGRIAEPMQGQAFFYFGEDVNLFAEQFRSIGHVVPANFRSLNQGAHSHARD